MGSEMCIRDRPKAEVPEKPVEKKETVNEPTNVSDVPKKRKTMKGPSASPFAGLVSNMKI